MELSHWGLVKEEANLKRASVPRIDAQWHLCVRGQAWGKGWGSRETVSGYTTWPGSVDWGESLSVFRRPKCCTVTTFPPPGLKRGGSTPPALLLLISNLLRPNIGSQGIRAVGRHGMHSHTWGDAFWGLGGSSIGGRTSECRKATASLPAPSPARGATRGTGGEVSSSGEAGPPRSAQPP